MPKIQTPESKEIRSLILFFSVVIGLVFGWLINCHDLLAFMGIGFETHGAVSAVILVASLPTLTVLWWFRTHDTRQQIQKTQEAINANLFGMYQKMLRAEKKEERSSGLLGLIGIKQKGLFEEEIDFITQQNLDLDETMFRHMNLSDVKLRYASIKEAKLQGANLSNADLYHADLSGINLQEARLNYAFLMKANLYKAILCRAKLKGASLRAAHLGSADLSSADLSGAYLNDAFLHGAKLVGADLSGADLSGAKIAVDRSKKEKSLGDDLLGSLDHLTEDELIDADLTEAKYNKETKFPDGFDPEAAGMKLIERPNHRK